MSSIKRNRTLAEISPNAKISPGKRAREHASPKKICRNLIFDQENFEDLLNDSNLIALLESENKESDTFMRDPIRKPENVLRLETWTRCTICDVIRDKNFDLILELSPENDANVKVICRLQGVWANTQVVKGELVHVVAKWNQSLQCFIVNNNDGSIVTNPDHLISVTTVVGSLFCARKAVLQERFRGIDSQNKLMTIGSITHELFQTVLRRKLRQLPEIEKACIEILKSESVMYMLYASKMSADEMQTELTPFIYNIKNFVEQYVYGRKPNVQQNESFAGVIETIEDIEENVWVPRLGLKGKIDVSVRVQSHIDPGNSESKYMPLELKTGRATFSNEHKGQIFLYEMMLNEIGKKVDSGLLLYLREGIMKEIRPTTNSKRDIIMLRNDLSHYLTRKLKINDYKNQDEILAKYKCTPLPETIDRYNGCSKCPYNIICTSYLKQDHPEALSTNATFQKISQEFTSHLNDADIEYFTHWSGILALEDHDMKCGGNVKHLWTKTSKQRRNEGHAIIDLQLVGQVTAAKSKFLHNFEATSELTEGLNFNDFTLTGMNPGDYVVVSIAKRAAIAAGHVYDVKKSQISVELERNLLENYSNEKFIIDKYPSQSSNVFNFTNLGVLLEDREESNILRKIVVDKMKATFDQQKIQIPKSGKEIYKDLNLEQKNALKKSIYMDNYMLMKGLPGTGKTQTLVAIIRLLYLLGKSIVITSHTHSAVDNVLQRLKCHNIEFLRLGSDTRIDSSLHDCSETTLASNCKTPSDLAHFYASYKIVGVTCHGAGHPIFLHRRFDVCIVDEATQVFQPTILRPLFYAEKFILVGDPEQLPPVVKSSLARKIGASESLFHRLDDPATTAILSSQYRMNKTITKLANGLTYSGSLLCANVTVANGTVDLPNKFKLFTEFKKDKWLLRTLEKHVDMSVMMLDTKNCLQRSLDFEKSMSVGLSEIIEKTFSDDASLLPQKLTYTNYCDAAIVFYLIKALLVGDFPAAKIGVIAPYRAQVELLRKIHEYHLNFYSRADISSDERIDFNGLEVNTVDQFQGRDKDVIIYSCTRTGLSAVGKTSSERGDEILEDKRRLTVAITRSKCKLILVGDGQCLERYTPFIELLSKIPSRCKIILEDETLGFRWCDILSELKKVF